MCIVFQNQLFKMEKSFFVIDLKFNHYLERLLEINYSLSGLNDCIPGIFGLEFSTTITLLRLYDIFNNENLLENGRGENLIE